MERRHFLLAAASSTAALAAAAAALGATPIPYATPLPGFSALPTRSPRPGSSISPYKPLHHHASRPTDLEHIHRRLERLISVLEQYQQTHSGHVTQAIAYLQQADSEIVTEMSTNSPIPAP